MNFKKYMFLVLSLMCLFVFSFYLNTVNTYDNTPYVNHKSKSYISDDKSTHMSGTDIKVEPYYVVNVEDDNLCAYKIEGDKKTLLNTNKINLAHFEKAEINKLKEGITTDTYEKMCMYFENYIS